MLFRNHFLCQICVWTASESFLEVFFSERIRFRLIFKIPCINTNNWDFTVEFLVEFINFASQKLYLGRHPPPPPGRPPGQTTPPPSRQLLQRTVRILLEWILVYLCQIIRLPKIIWSRRWYGKGDNILVLVLKTDKFNKNFSEQMLWINWSSVNPE